MRGDWGIPYQTLSVIIFPTSKVLFYFSVSSIVRMKVRYPSHNTYKKDKIYNKLGHCFSLHITYIPKRSIIIKRARPPQFTFPCN
tara:strand:+ start:479 stop:733 length:255 start_codon:yes stop_codon:yes gene_type:complete